MTLHWELAFDNPPLFFSFAVYLQKCYFIEKERVARLPNLSHTIHVFC